MRGQWDQRLTIFRDGFAPLAADVMTLQETILTSEADQAATMLGGDYQLAHQSDRETDGHIADIAAAIAQRSDRDLAT